MVHVMVEHQADDVPQYRVRGGGGGGGGGGDGRGDDGVGGGGGGEGDGGNGGGGEGVGGEGDGGEWKLTSWSRLTDAPTAVLGTIANQRPACQKSTETNDARWLATGCPNVTRRTSTGAAHIAPTHIVPDEPTRSPQTA